MNWIRKALSPLINLYNYRSGVQQQVSLNVGLPAVYPKSETITYINAYCNNASVYTVINTIAKKFGYIPRYVYQIKDKPAAQAYSKYIKQKDFNLSKAIKLRKKAYEEQVVDNKLSQLLKHPNPQQGQDDFFTLCDIYYDSTGECFIWLNRGELQQVNEFGELEDVVGDARLKKPIIEMWVLPSQFMAINVDRNDMMGEILNYIFIKNGTQMYIPKEDIIHWKTGNPQYDAFNYTHLRGLSPLQPGKKLLTGDNAAMDAMTAMYQNGGSKGIAFEKSGKQLTRVQISALDDALDSKVNNRSMKGAVVQTPGDWGYIDLAVNAVDMDLMEGQDKMRDYFCNLYQMNPNLLKSGQTFDNLEQARKDFITQTVLPRACSQRDELNRGLLMAFGFTEDSFSIDVDVTNLPELQDDMGKQVTSLNTAWWLTGNEKRQEMNEESLPDENMDKIVLPTTMGLLDDIGVDTSAMNTYIPSANGTTNNTNGKPPVPGAKN